jgi:hypothetical protein
VFEVTLLPWYEALCWCVCMYVWMNVCMYTTARHRSTKVVRWSTSGTLTSGRCYPCTWRIKTLRASRITEPPHPNPTPNLNPFLVKYFVNPSSLCLSRVIWIWSLYVRSSLYHVFMKRKHCSLHRVLFSVNWRISFIVALKQMENKSYFIARKYHVNTTFTERHSSSSSSLHKRTLKPYIFA